MRMHPDDIPRACQHSRPYRTGQHVVDWTLRGVLVWTIFCSVSAGFSRDFPGLCLALAIGLAVNYTIEVRDRAG